MSQWIVKIIFLLCHHPYLSNLLWCPQMMILKWAKWQQQLIKTLIGKQCFTERHHSSLISSNCERENNEATVMFSIYNMSSSIQKKVFFFRHNVTVRMDFNVAMAEGFEALRRSIKEVRTDTHPSFFTRLFVPVAAQVSRQALKV